MSFIPRTATSNHFALRFFKKTASTAYANLSLVAWPATQTGFMIPATATTTKHVGAIQKAVASTDSDYASNTLVPVLVPTAGQNSIWIATTASAVVTDIGGTFDLTDASTVNRGAEAVGAFQSTDFINATSMAGYLVIPTSTT